MNEKESEFSFLGESPLKWMAFIALFTIFLAIWGRVINFLGGVE